MAPEESFTQGVAVITGAGSGLGAELAGEAARRGMTVAVADISKDRAQSVVRDITAAGGRAHAFETDVRSDRAVDALARAVHETLGDVRLLVNNAGIEMLGLSWELTAEQWRAAMEININGVFYGVRAFVPHMIEATKRGGRAAIVNLSSVGGLSVAPIMTPYTVSKHAVLAFSECLSLEMELTGTPIDVSVVTPGPVSTRIFEDAIISPGERASWADRNRALLHHSLATDGIDIAEAGRRIFAQLVERKFWISTHPEMTEVTAASRADYLRVRPALSPIILDSFGLEKAR